MGTYVVQVEAVGGHGCQREVKEGQAVPGCGMDTCPDCTARRFVADLKRKGNSVVKAKLTHWPAFPVPDVPLEKGTSPVFTGSVVDDLLTGIRKGNFG